ncbi:MAG TPA: hypothetical protein VJT08_07315 [Terriglobales bacterium]|nr:hypothetical protein [Terriglobales bacterium]
MAGPHISVLESVLAPKPRQPYHDVEGGFAPAMESKFFPQPGHRIVLHPVRTISAG